MKTCVFGYPDVEGKGPATLLFGSENGVANNRREFNDIKVSGNYPPGIVRVELWNDEVHMREVGINVGKTTEKQSTKKAKRHEKDSE